MMQAEEHLEPEQEKAVEVEPPTDTLTALFTYQKPTDETIPKYKAIREGALAFARIIDANCPASADRTVAMRKLREAVMDANASIATGGQHYR
jgi:hypothetical protein